ncbi:hypothetical protein GS538_20635 [Rhodococcus hoagii]|nr:hypothetical protein [Prescottella equi]
MALDVGTLYATLTVKDDQFTSGLNRAEGRLNTVDKTVQKTTKSTVALGAAGANAGKATGQGAQQATAGVNSLAAALGKAKNMAGVLGVTMGAAGAVKFFTDAVQNARALGAQTNQLNVIFGESKQEIMDWGKTASSQLFISQREAQGAAITFATFGAVAGKSGKNLAAFSKDMTKLAVETASFSGVATSDVIEAMGSAFQGQAIPMRKYGVLLSDATLRQTALKNGIIDTNRVLTGSEKVQATELAMKEQLVAVNGDIERSQGKLGQNLKGLGARYEEVSAKIGGALTPAVNSFVALLSGPGLSAVSGMADGLGVLASGVQALAGFFGGLPGPLQAVVVGMVAAKLAATGFGTALQGAVVSRMAAAGTAVSGFASGAVDKTRRSLDGIRLAMMYAGEGSTGMASKMRAAGAGGVAAFKAGVSGLTSVLGGPFGIAIMAATLGVGHWMSETSKAKQAAKDVATSAQSVAEQLEQTGGHFTAEGEKAAMAALETIKLSDGTTTLKDALQNANVPLSQAARGIAGMGDAADKTRQQLADMHHDERENLSWAAKRWQELKGAFTGNYADQQYWNDDSGRWETDYDTESGEALKKINELQEQIAAKRQQIVSSLNNGEMAEKFKISADTHELDVMTEAMETFADSASGAADKVSALSKALDSLAQDDLTVENAQQSLNDAIRDLNTEMNDAEAAANGAGRSMYDAGGHIDTFSKAGSKLHDTLQDVSSGLGQVAAATYEDEFAKGNYAGALDVTRAKLTEQYTALLDSAEAAGWNRDKYAELLAQYGATPEVIMTRLDIVNAQTAQDLITAFQGQVESVPDEKTVILKTISDDARAKIESYGFEVEDLPEGKGVKVTADTDQAVTALQSIGGQVDGIPERKDVEVGAPGADTVAGMLEDIGVKVNEDNDKNIVIESNSDEVLDKLEALNIRTTTLDDGKVTIVDNSDEVRRKIEQNLNGKTTRGQHIVDIVTNGSLPTGAAPRANGGIDEYADGGVRPMPDKAHIQPGSGRGLVRYAEGETGWEAYIPGADSKRGRSTAILREVAKRFGYRLEAFANGGFGGNVGSLPENAQISNLPADPGIPLSSRRSVNPLAQLGEGANRLGVALGSVGSAGIDFLASSGFAKDSIADLVRMNGGGGASGFAAGGSRGGELLSFEDWVRQQMFLAAGLGDPFAETEQELAERKEQLRKEIEKGVKDEERAKIAVEKAQEANDEAVANTDGKKSDRDRREAALNLSDALDRLEEAQAKNRELAETYANPEPQRSSGGGARSSSTSGLAPESRAIVDSLGGGLQARGGGAPITVHVGMVNNGPVTVNDPEEVIKPELAGAQGDPIGDSMARLGV